MQDQYADISFIMVGIFLKLLSPPYNYFEGFYKIYQTPVANFFSKMVLFNFKYTCQKYWLKDTYALIQFHMEKFKPI